MNIKEVWRPVMGYEGLYEVSNRGRVKSLNCNRTGKDKILKAEKTKRGYLRISLYKDGNVKHLFVHRLVAMAFLELVEGKEFVDHINGDKTYNRVENLRWCTQKENSGFPLARDNKSKAMKISMNRPETKEKQRKAHLNRQDQSKPVLQFRKDGELIAEYPSLHEAGRQTGFEKSNISNCCKGRLKSAGGFIWCYKLHSTTGKKKLSDSKQSVKQIESPVLENTSDSDILFFDFDYNVIRFVV